MIASQSRIADAELRRLGRVKHAAAAPAKPFGAELVDFFQHSVQKRQSKLSGLAASWEMLVPPTLSEHCALDAFSRGTLTVLMDSASHRYELKQLLLAGLQQQLLLACKPAGLKKIVLKAGRWDDALPAEHRKRNAN